MTAKIDYLGQVFGALTIVSSAPSSVRMTARWQYRCVCGTEGIVGRGTIKDWLRRDVKPSCGCALCLRCGVEFKQNHHNDRYCSKDCRVIARRADMDRFASRHGLGKYRACPDADCIICGRTLAINRRHAQVTCSPECGRQHRRETAIRWALAHRTKRTCTVCQAVFQNDRGEWNQKYCSKECRRIATARRAVGYRAKPERKAKAKERQKLYLATMTEDERVRLRLKQRERYHASAAVRERVKKANKRAHLALRVLTELGIEI